MNADGASRYERERRFVVEDASIVNGWPNVLITQAYLWSRDGYASRVRLVQRVMSGGDLADLDATFAIKGPRIGDERFEAEAQLHDADVAREIIARAEHIVRKRRYQVVDVEAWDVDVFLDDNDGLIIAELEGSDVRSVRRPEWCAREVTHFDEYNNENLATSPWRRWSEGAR